METNNIKNQAEAILFFYGDPISAKKLAKLTGAKEAAVVAALLELEREYSGRGLRLVKNGDEWQLATAPEAAPILTELTKSEYSQNLSRAALETLSIVAYKGPLTHAELEFIRGVNSVYSLRNLLMRGLIEKKENPSDGRSHIYSVTFDFLRHFGFSEIAELPRYDEFHAAEVPKAPTEESES